MSYSPDRDLSVHGGSFVGRSTISARCTLASGASIFAIRLVTSDVAGRFFFRFARWTRLDSTSVLTPRCRLPIGEIDEVIDDPSLHASVVTFGNQFDLVENRQMHLYETARSVEAQVLTMPVRSETANARGICGKSQKMTLRSCLSCCPKSGLMGAVPKMGIFKSWIG
jgi:hypothetical protein